MLTLARFSTRRPFLAIALWFAVAASLAAIGLGISHALSPTIVVVPGTQTSRAEDLARERFGPSVLVPVLLEGPGAQLDKQGPALVAALSAREDTRVLSAWDGGDTGESLRPDRRHAMIVVSLARSEREMVDGVQAQIDAIVDRRISAPVRSYVTGTPTIAIATKDQSLDAARRAELLALPILFGVLLLVLRAPVAALVLTALGGVTTLMSFGAMALLGTFIDVDATAVTLASMAGLTLGVGYAVLVYRRWRTERDLLGTHDRQSEALAAAVAAGTMGRAVLIGGTALVLALVAALVLGPFTIVLSLGIGATLCAALAIGGAVVVLPALMTVLGRRLQAFSFRYPAFVRAPWTALSERGGSWVVRNAIGAGAVATAALAVLALPLTNLETGPIAPTLLPKSDPARVSYEKISAVMGDGFATPFDIVVSTDSTPITRRTMLRKLDAFQQSIAADPRVASVVGPGDLYATTADLKQLPKQLKSSKKMLKTAPKGLKQLEQGLGTAGTGTEELQAGLATAASGAQQLASGSGKASSGSAQLHAGLRTAQAGAAQISGGLNSALAGAQQLQTGAGQLKSGTSDALSGSKQIAGGLGQAVAQVKPGVPVVKAMAGDVAAGATSVKSAVGSAQTTVAQINEATARLAALQGAAGDPAYQGAVAALAQARDSAATTSASIGAAENRLSRASAVSAAVASQLADLSSGLQQLYGGSQALSAGIAKLNAGAGKLHTGEGALVSGVGQLSRGGGSLTAGLQKLTTGSGELENGLNQLWSGSQALASGLGSAPGEMDPLISGLDKMRLSVAKFRGSLPSAKDIERLMASSPGLFNSGYFVLAAVDGSPAASRNQAASVVNVDRGATGGLIMVVPKRSATDPVTRELGADLVHRSERFAKATGTEIAVGGLGGAFTDFTTAPAERIWPVIGGAALAALVLLIVTLRMVVLPAVAVAFNLLTAAATFGILTVLYSGGDPLLGGPGYVDPVSIIGIFAFVFGVSLVYQVILLQRTREVFLELGDPREAVRAGLVTTAAAATGAAAVMVAAIFPFATAELLTVQMFGVGAAIAIVLDALLVRPVLLPAAAALLGRWSWWPLSRRAPADERPAPPDGLAPA